MIYPYSYYNLFYPPSCAPPTDQKFREYIMLTSCVRATNRSTTLQVYHTHSMSPRHPLINNSEMTWRLLHRKWKLANLIKQNKSKENCMRHTFILRTFHGILLSWTNQSVIHVKTFSTHGGHRKCTHTKLQARNLDGRDHFADLPCRRRWWHWTSCQRSIVSGLNSTGSGYRPSSQTLWECNRTRFSVTRQRISWSTA